MAVARLLLPAQAQVAALALPAAKQESFRRNLAVGHAVFVDRNALEVNASWVQHQICSPSSTVPNHPCTLVCD